MKLNKEIKPITDYQSGKQYLFYLLSRRDYSQVELQRKLTERCCPTDIISTLLTEFTENNWQSDQRFAFSLFKYKANSGYGVNYIQQLLKQHQISEDLNEFANAAEIDWYEQLMACYQKKYNGKPIKDYQDKQKRFRFLYSRGYPSELIQSLF